MSNKKALKSNRNRHTGRINEFKRQVIELAIREANGKIRHSDGSKYLAAWIGYKVKGTTMVRVN